MPAFLEYKPPSAKIPGKRDKIFHVFLGSSGKDVRRTLVDHLYVALTTAGLDVFHCSENLVKGEIIDSSLDRVIESSAIRVPIFSRGFAESTWCLREATAMLRTPGLIIPLFYDVDPIHVGHPLNENSPYKYSFDKHYGRSERYSREEVDEWKDALHKIWSYSGWSLESTAGFEARLIKRVVKDIIETFHELQFKVAAGYLVGMEKVKNALIQKLSLHLRGEVVKVGIWGIGGIGKTTAAKAVYDEVNGGFKAACFVYNVRDTPAEASNLTQLQKKVLNDLSKYSGEVGSVNEGISLFKCHLKKNSVLLVLDDVDNVIQLNALVGDWLAPGSRIIITSRDKEILNGAGISPDCIEEMNGLDAKESLQLFNWHAFNGETPLTEYEDLSHRIVENCKGHPLSLELIGSMLFGEDDKSHWEGALRNISALPSIHERLKISYNVLTFELKEMFVDIACFFIGEHKYLPILFWESLYRMPEPAISKLCMKSLIKIDYNDVFGMHDHLRDMGRTIAEKEKEGTRLWHDVQLSTISNNINACLLRLNGGNSVWIEMLYKLPALRYLYLQNLTIEGMRGHTIAVLLPPALIWLRLENCHFAVQTSRVKKEPRLSGIVDDIGQVKIIQLKFCHGVDSFFISPLCSLPNKQLLHLDLEGCVSLNNLPDSIDNLSQLQRLNLRACVSLKNLPCTIGNLSQMQQLNLGGCYSLKNLPHTIGNLSDLQRLDLEETVNLENLPYTIGNLLKLQILNLKDCISLQNLPDSIGFLSSLQYLNLKECINLQRLPGTIDKLLPLPYLNLEGCLNLQNLPQLS